MSQRRSYVMYVKYLLNASDGRNGNHICKITPHHMAGVMSGAACGAYLQSTPRQASANYCIGVDGDIDCEVEEVIDTEPVEEKAAYDEEVQIQIYHPYTEAELQTASKDTEIADLKQRLMDTDYEAIKHSEGWITDGDYADTKAQRQKWRDRINELEH